MRSNRSHWRGSRLAYRRKMAVFAVTCLSFSGPVNAGDAASSSAEQFAVSEGGVDMRTGRYALREVDLSIGSADTGGITFTRLLTTAIGGHEDPFGNLSHDWDILITEKLVDLNGGNLSHGSGSDARMQVHFGGRSETFDQAAGQGAFFQVSRVGFARLGLAGTKFVFFASDGTRIVFRPLANSECSSLLRCAFAESVTRPDGTQFRLNYDSYVPGQPNTTRLRRLTSSRGYAVVLEYGLGDRVGLVTRTCPVNTASTLEPTADGCPINAFGAVTYDYVSFQPSILDRRPFRLSSVNGPIGPQTQYQYTIESGATKMKFFRGQDSQPWLTNTLIGMFNPDVGLEEIVLGQDFANGKQLSYQYDEIPSGDVPEGIAGGSYTDQSGARVVVEYGMPRLPTSFNYPSIPPPPCVTYYAPGSSTAGAGGSPEPVTLCGHMFNYRPPVTFGSIVFQITPGPTLVKDRLGRVHKATYCDPNMEANAPPNERHRCLVTLLQSTEDPEGNKLIFETAWATRTTTKVTAVGKAGSGASNIVTTATYDSCSNLFTCTKPLTRTGARGDVTEWTYAPEHGGILTETGPAPSAGAPRPQTRYQYVQREAWLKAASGGYAPTGQPIWLMSRKASCKTSAASGNGCVGGVADELVTLYDYGPEGGPNNLNLRGIVEDANGAALRICYAYDWQGNKISETKPQAGLTSCP